MIRIRGNAEVLVSFSLEKSSDEKYLLTPWLGKIRVYLLYAKVRMVSILNFGYR